MTRKWTEKEIHQLNQQTEKVCLKTLKSTLFETKRQK